MFFLTMGLTQSVLGKNIEKYVHNSGHRGSPDMILSAFDMKFNETKDEISPRACRRPNKFQKFKKNVPGHGSPPVRPPERRVGGVAAPGKEQSAVRGAAPPSSILVTS